MTSGGSAMVPGEGGGELVRDGDGAVAELEAFPARGFVQVFADDGESVLTQGVREGDIDDPRTGACRILNLVSLHRLSLGVDDAKVRQGKEILISTCSHAIRRTEVSPHD